MGFGVAARCRATNYRGACKRRRLSGIWCRPIPEWSWLTRADYRDASIAMKRRDIAFHGGRNGRVVDLTQPFTTPDIETGYQVDAVVKAVGEPACTDSPSVCNAVGRVVTLAGERQERDKHESKKLHARRGTVGKTAAVGMKDRDSGMVAGEVADTADKHTLQGFVAVDTEVDAVVCTDEHGYCEGVPRPHQTVEHTVQEHVDGQDRTNGI